MYRKDNHKHKQYSDETQLSNEKLKLDNKCNKGYF